MSDRKIEKVFTVEVPIERAWRAFADSHERSQWEAATYEIDPVPGGRVHWTLPGIESTLSALDPFRLDSVSAVLAPPQRGN